MNDLTKLLLDWDQYEEHKEDVREVYLKAPWSMPGSKYKSLHKILPELPYSKVWIDACFGTGVVTLNRRKSPLEIMNDRFAGCTAFYRALRNNYDELLARLKCVVHSREEFIWCRDTWQNYDDDVERAARWYYMIRTSFSQIGRNWARSVAGESMIAPKYFRSLKLFPEIHYRLLDVQIENLDVVQCIKDYDSHESVFYIDPDYLTGKTKTDQGIYNHEVDHVKMLDTVMNSKGFFAVSCYPNDLYDSYKWTKRKTWEIWTPIKAQAKNAVLGSRPMDRERVTEVLYLRDFK